MTSAVDNFFHIKLCRDCRFRTALCLVQKNKEINKHKYCDFGCRKISSFQAVYSVWIRKKSDVDCRNISPL